MTRRERLDEFRELSAALKAANATVSELEVGREQAAFERVVDYLDLERYFAAGRVWEQGIRHIEDLFALLEVALVLTDFESRDSESKFEAFDGDGCIAIVYLFRALIELRQRKSLADLGDFGGI